MLSPVYLKSNFTLHSSIDFGLDASNSKRIVEILKLCDIERIHLHLLCCKWMDVQEKPRSPFDPLFSQLNMFGRLSWMPEMRRFICNWLRRTHNKSFQSETKNTPNENDMVSFCKIKNKSMPDWIIENLGFFSFAVCFYIFQSCTWTARSIASMPAARKVFQCLDSVI